MTSTNENYKLEITLISTENNEYNDFINKLIDCHDNIFKNSTVKSVTKEWCTMIAD